MSAVYFLTLRQLTGRWRLLVMTALALMPVVISVLMVSNPDAPTVGSFEQAVLSVMLFGSIAPLIVLALAAPAFANEIEDRTIANLTLSPMSRTAIVAAKLLAVISIAAPFIGASAFATGYAAFLGDVKATLAITVSALAGVVLYASAFQWLGLVTTQAIGVGLAYIVLWDGFFAGFVSGARILSISHHSIALMHGIDPRRFDMWPHVNFVVALVVAVAFVAVFNWLSVGRLRRMDVP